MSENQRNNIAIEVKDLIKSFKIPLDGGSSLKQKIIHFIKREKGYRIFTPLDDVSFSIEQGEFFGIVGRNGSGKSTLLKTMAGIYTPDRGSVAVKGTLVPFIELGVGFNPELTGRENVFLNGALLGFSRKEMEVMYEDIVDFAELHDFMEERLKNYSSGMQVRLAFSIAIRAKGDILLLDEVLAVGDSAFQQKCYDYFDQLKNENKTVILVSHSMGTVQRYCDRALLLNKGKVEYVGSSDEAAAKYEEIFIAERANKEVADEIKEEDERKKKENVVDLVNVVDVQTFQDGKKVKKVEAFKDFEFIISLSSYKDLEQVNVGFNIKNSKKDVLSAFSIKHHTGNIDLKKNEVVTLRVGIQNIFTNDNYTVNLAIAEQRGSGETLIARKPSVLTFEVRGVKFYKNSLTHPRVTISKDV